MNDNIFYRTNKRINYMSEKINSENLEENLETIANEIKKLKNIGEILSKSELNEKTIIWLISRASGVNQTHCSLVMSSLQRLEEIFLKWEE